MMPIRGKALRHNPAREADYVRTMGEIVDRVNSAACPETPFNWFAWSADAKAAVHVKDGSYAPGLSDRAALLGGTVEAGRASDLRVCASDGKTGGIFVEGPGRFEAERVAVSLSGDSAGIGGPATGAAVRKGGEMILRQAVIRSAGLTHYATVAEEHSVLRVYDSVLSSHGIPFGEGQPQPEGIMRTPPPGLMIEGNSRTHCTMTGSQSYFYRCTILCDGWGALSTEAAEGYVYLEANDSKVVTLRRGYGAYADPGCHVVLNRCGVDSADMAGIVGGQGEMILRDCEVRCGACFLLLHSVMGVAEEISHVEVSGGRIRSRGAALLIRSDNAVVVFDRAELHSDQGVLVHTQINADPLAAPAGDAPYGIDVTFRSMDLQGDILHEDVQRELFVCLESSVWRGAMRNGCLRMDGGSKWTATADSELTLLGEIQPAQLDAQAGVTIMLHCGQSGQMVLPSGGALMMVADLDNN